MFVKPSTILSKLRNAWHLLQKRHVGVLAGEVRKRLHSEALSFGLQRNLSKEFKAPEARIDFRIRPLKEGDADQLLENSDKHPVPPGVLSYQRRLVSCDIPNCYVAVTADDTPCYMQWLIGFEDRDKIDENFYKGVFPPLGEGEALLEGAYSSTKFRGLGIMPAAMARIAERASEINTKRIITFVNITNLPSLKGCHRAGFEPYILRRDNWFLFRRNISFHPLPENLMETYRKKIVGKRKQSVESARPGMEASA